MGRRKSDVTKTRENQALIDAAKDNLLGYCSLINERYETPAHIVKLALLLEAVERGDKKRVIITIPPRHGKSYLCSQYFPAWYLGRNPDKYIMCATYGQDLADDFGRKVRDQLQDTRFQAVFGQVLRKDTTAADRMTTTKGGAYIATGVGGAITGRGAHLFLIDDPVKDREQADSPTWQQRTYDWFRSVAYTRLMPDASIVIIMTRWAEDDIVGRILASDMGKSWEVIKLQALSEHNDALWPERYDLQTLLDIKDTLGVYDWSCLYQQEPQPQEGVLFKRESIKSGCMDNAFYDGCFMAVDPAIGKKEVNDETAISVVKYKIKHPDFIADEACTYHGHWNFEEQLMWCERIYRSQLPRPTYIGVEDVGYQRVLGETLIRKGLPVMMLKVTHDKVARAVGVSHLISQGRVRVNTPELIGQLLSFRGETERNDMVDAFVHALGMVQKFTPKADRPKVDRYAGMSPDARRIAKIFDHEERVDLGLIDGQEEDYSEMKREFI